MKYYTWNWSPRFQMVRIYMVLYYNIDESAERGNTWKACNECFMHDIISGLEQIE